MKPRSYALGMQVNPPIVGICLGQVALASTSLLVSGLVRARATISLATQKSVLSVLTVSAGVAYEYE